MKTLLLFFLEALLAAECLGEEGSLVNLKENKVEEAGGKAGIFHLGARLRRTTEYLDQKIPTYIRMFWRASHTGHDNAIRANEILARWENLKNMVLNQNLEKKIQFILPGRIYWTLLELDENKEWFNWQQWKKIYEDYSMMMDRLNATGANPNKVDLSRSGLDNDIRGNEILARWEKLKNMVFNPHLEKNILFSLPRIIIKTLLTLEENKEWFTWQQWKKIDEEYTMMMDHLTQIGVITATDFDSPYDVNDVEVYPNDDETLVKYDEDPTNGINNEIKHYEDSTGDDLTNDDEDLTNDVLFFKIKGKCGRVVTGVFLPVKEGEWNNDFD